MKHRNLPEYRTAYGYILAPPALVSGLERYFRFYNEERLHQALTYRTPAQVYGVA